ncbi:phosphodiester glycosidase family protein [Streptomyces sp. NPDC006879]|uniref:phosphodiester glycosidase family protein n=1 Tax=Streptomyces sp. NPDC006879 TaxID=3364767 RepID=UPI0036C2D0A3
MGTKNHLRRAAIWLLAGGLCLTGCTGHSGEAHGKSGGPVPARSAPPLRPPLRVAEGIDFSQYLHRLKDGAPLRVSVLKVAPVAQVKVHGVHGADLSTAETVRSMAAAAGAIAAVNGSFFDIETGKNFSGYEGDPLGVYSTGGNLLSEAASGQTALVLARGGSRITEVTSTSLLTSSDGATRTLDGVNRVPGRILGCGGAGDETLARTGEPVSVPLHNRLCLDKDEIIDFRPAWGKESPRGATGSVEAVLNANGQVVRLRSPAGGPIPVRGRTLCGVGEGARWLAEHARIGTTVKATSQLYDREGERISGPGTSVIGAGPALVRDGQTWVNTEDNGFNRGALTGRHPRTAVGILADGTLLLVTMDGRNPGVSVGASLPEEAQIMKDLHAVEALNMDGGGSSTMVVKGKVTNRPTETEGGPQVERPLANAIAVVP